MTMPNLNDIEELEFTRYDVIMIILNIIGYFILGFWGLTRYYVYVLVASTLFIGIIVFVAICFKMCCWPDSRQAVFAPYGREHYD
jgi:uncharacterized membrane protein YccF (DUF307 family)|tara:strand:- start:708 stop:962 length:255 start_codon:yes stop_codon:yes gene_type:complete